jgi:hypothetical protein
MGKARTDNYRSTHQAIASRVLANPLAAAAASHYAERLTDWAAGQGDLSAWSYLNIEFRRADTNCDLTVRLDAKDSFSRDTDEQGEWRSYTVRCEINWPSHGSAAVATSMARLHLYQQVAMLAAEIEAEFGGRNEIHHLVATAAEIAERDAKRAADKRAAKIRDLVEANRRNLRVGSERALGADLITDIESGRHEVAIGESMKYTLFVTAGVGANLMRVA